MSKALPLTVDWCASSSGDESDQPCSFKSSFVTSSFGLCINYSTVYTLNFQHDVQHIAQKRLRFGCEIILLGVR